MLPLPRWRRATPTTRRSATSFLTHDGAPAPSKRSSGPPCATRCPSARCRPPSRAGTFSPSPSGFRPARFRGRPSARRGQRQGSCRCSLLTHRPSAPSCATAPTPNALIPASVIGIWRVLGVRPGSQREGLGTRLIQPVLDRADADGDPCFLETSDRANVPYYERFGFSVIDDDLHLVPNGPSHVAMRRAARP